MAQANQLTPSPAEDRPLLRFLDDDHLRIMERLIPYCSLSAGRMLALQIKLLEINKILRDFDEPQLQACGLEEDRGDMESMLRALKKGVSPEMGDRIDSMLQMIHFMKMYQRFSQISREHPELMGMMTGDADTKNVLDLARSGGENMDMNQMVHLLTSLIGRQPN